MEKIQYLIIGMGLSLTLIGLLAGGVIAGPDTQNVTPVNDTLETVNITEEPAPEEEIIEEYEEELTPADEIAIREAEKAEEAALIEEEEPEEEETIVSPPEPSEEDTIEEPIEAQIKAPEKDEIKPVTVTEKQIFVEEKKTTPQYVTLKKTVNASGFIFVGPKYAGEVVEIRVIK